MSENMFMEEEFFDTWWKDDGIRLLLPDGQIPGLEDYVKAAYLAGYKKRIKMEQTIQKLRNKESEINHIFEK